MMKHIQAETVLAHLQENQAMAMHKIEELVHCHFASQVRVN